MRGTTAITTNEVKAKGTGNGRNVGKLAQLMGMPLDVFFEVRHVLALHSSSYSGCQ